MPCEQKEVVGEEIDINVKAFKQFDLVCDHSDHYYSKATVVVSFSQIICVVKLVATLFTFFFFFYSSNSPCFFVIENIREQEIGQKVFRMSGRFSRIIYLVSLFLQ